MRLIQNAYAGTLESSDTFVDVSPLKTDEIKITLQSSVEEIYGDTIREVILQTVKKMEITGVHLKVHDKGALDFVLQARVQTALLRGCEEEKPQWEKL